MRAWAMAVDIEKVLLDSFFDFRRHCPLPGHPPCQTMSLPVPVLVGACSYPVVRPAIRRPHLKRWSGGCPNKPALRFSSLLGLLARPQPPSSSIFSPQ